MNEPMPHPLSVARTGVTVSVVSHGQARYCLRLVEDLARHSAGSVGKLILTLNIPEELPALGDLPFEVDVIRNAEPKGFALNHNQAFSRASGPYFAVLNPDLRLEHDPFPDLVTRLTDPAVGIVAPKVLEPDGSLADSARTLVSPWEVLRRRFSAGHRSAHVPRRGDQPDWMAGIFLIFRSGTYETLGGFDDRYFLYCEDVDICARARLMGLRLEFVHDASVTHYAQRASRRALRYTCWHLTSLLRLWSSPVYHRYRRQLHGRSNRELATLA